MSDMVSRRPPNRNALLPHTAAEWPSKPDSKAGDTGSAAHAAPGLLLEGHRRTTWRLELEGVPYMFVSCERSYWARKGSFS
jgi:hypothetical protein